MFRFLILGPLCLMLLACGSEVLFSSGASQGRDVVILTNAVPSGVVYQDYEVQLEATGSEGSLRFDVVGGKLPDGLRMSEGGLISGRPSLPGSNEFEVRVLQPSGEGSNQTFEISVAPWQDIREIACGDTVDFSLQSSAIGGPAAYDLDKEGAVAFFALELSTEIAAVQLSLSGEGSADGDMMLPRYSYGPGIDEIYAYTLIEAHDGSGESLRLTDGTPYYNLGSYRDAGVLGVTIAAVQPGDFSLTVLCYESLAGGPDQLANAALGHPYSALLDVYMGTQPVTFSAQNLPEGLVLDENTGEISGTPVQSGQFSLDVSLTDGDSQVYRFSLPLWVVEPVQVGCNDSLDGQLLARAFDGRRGLASPEGVVFLELDAGSASEVSLSVIWAGEGEGSLSLWQALPGRMAGSSELSDYKKPLFAGAFTHTIAADGAFPNLAHYGSENIPLVLAAGGSPGDFELSIECKDDLQVADKALANPIVGEAYLAQVETLGSADQSIHYELIVGELPLGLQLDGTTGVISGTTEQVGSYSFMLRATAEGGAVAEKSFELWPEAHRCADLPILTCGSYEVGELSVVGWVNRVTTDLSLGNAYCLSLPSSQSGVLLSLGPKSGSNPDLFVGAPGASLRSQNIGDFPFHSTLDDFDEVELATDGFATLMAYGDGGIPINVLAAVPGLYTLEVSCW